MVWPFNLFNNRSNIYIYILIRALLTRLCVCLCLSCVPIISPFRRAVIIFFMAAHFARVCYTRIYQNTYESKKKRKKCCTNWLVWFGRGVGQRVERRAGAAFI